MALTTPAGPGQVPLWDASKPVRVEDSRAEDPWGGSSGMISASLRQALKWAPGTLLRLLESI